MLNGEGARVLSESGSGIACPAGDAQTLADSVLKLSAMGVEELEEMGRKGFEYSNQEFNRNILITKLEQLLLTTKMDKFDRRTKSA